MKYFMAVFVVLLWFGMGLANHEDIQLCEKEREATLGIGVKIIAYIGAPVFWPIVTAVERKTCIKDGAKP